MKKFLKIFGGIVLTLILLFIIALIVISHVIDPNRFKPMIESQVQKATGKILLIEGDLKWSLFPTLGIETGKVELQNPTGFSSKELVKITRARISIRIIPLVIGNIELGDVVLKGLDVHLIKSPSGAENWALPETPKTPAPAPAEPETTKSSGFSFNLAGIPDIDISDVQVTYTDEQTGDVYAVQNLMLSLKKPVAGKAFPVDMAFDISSKNPAINARLAFTSDVTLNINDGYYKLEDLDLTAQIESDKFARKKVKLSTQGNLTLDLKNKFYTLKDFTVKLNDLYATGYASVDQINHEYNGEFNLKSFNLRQLVADLGQQLPLLQNNHTLENVGGSFELEATDNTAALKELQLIVDDSQLNGTLTITDLQKMAGNFAITVNHINLDDYLPAPADKKSSNTSDTEQSQAAGPAQKPQFKADMQGTIDIDKFQAFKLQMQNVHVAIVAKDNSIEIDPLSANLYEGTLKATVRYNANPELPTYTATLSLDNIILDAMGQSLAQLSPEYSQLKNISGRANFYGVIVTQGLDALAIKQHLNGNIKFNVENGKIKGVDLAYYWHLAQDFINGSAAGLTQKGPNETEFGDITATATIFNGIINNNDLLMQSPVMRVKGSGKANLTEDSVDYRLMVTLQRSHVDEETGQRVYSEEGDDALPLVVDGKLSDPSISIDKKELLNVIADQAKKNLLDPSKKTLQNIIDKINF